MSAPEVVLSVLVLVFGGSTLFCYWQWGKALEMVEEVLVLWRASLDRITEASK